MYTQVLNSDRKFALIVRNCFNPFPLRVIRPTRAQRRRLKWKLDRDDRKPVDRGCFRFVPRSFHPPLPLPDTFKVNIPALSPCDRLFCRDWRRIWAIFFLQNLSIIYHFFLFYLSSHLGGGEICKINENLRSSMISISVLLRIWIPYLRFIHSFFIVKKNFNNGFIRGINDIILYFISLFLLYTWNLYFKFVDVNFVHGKLFIGKFKNYISKWVL